MYVQSAWLIAWHLRVKINKDERRDCTMKNIFIRGKPGSGKTTLIMKIVQSLKKKKNSPGTSLNDRRFLHTGDERGQGESRFQSSNT
ncbi:MAG: DUF2075 domain-containing protein [Thermodesulfovibrionia bacterium]|nr:DUF2075 domain-containing protein [Thermodesulfovibrionia bacterium]